VKSKSNYEADLHCHTTASDGSLSPEETVRLAKEKGLRALAITDHDTIEGWGKAEKASAQLGIVLLKGIEINTDWEGHEIHILGYGMKEHDPVFLNELRVIQKKRISRIEQMLEKLEQFGIRISFEEVMDFAHGESIGRPHVAQAMLRKGFAATTKEAFHHYLRIGAPAYVPRYKLSPSEAIHMIRQAGGVTVLAHPGAYKVETHLEEWIKAGLQGIEVFHPKHTFQDNIHYGMIAERMGLIATGGSDFHGPQTKPEVELGGWGVGMDVVIQIASKIIT